MIYVAFAIVVIGVMIAVAITAEAVVSVAVAVVTVVSRRKRLRAFFKLAKAQWTLSADVARGVCLCPECGDEPYKGRDDKTTWGAGLCWKCSHDQVCLRQALRYSRGEGY